MEWIYMRTHTCHKWQDVLILIQMECVRTFPIPNLYQECQRTNKLKKSFLVFSESHELKIRNLLAIREHLCVPICS